MGRETAIAWCDHTFNPWWGCVKISPGCEHCYAEAWARRCGQQRWGLQADYRYFGEKHWAEPLKWERDAYIRMMNSGERTRVFCGSMCDIFDHRADEGERNRLFGMIQGTPHLTWLLLTKRPENIATFWPEHWGEFPPENLWLGITAENQSYLLRGWG
jgi:protein gp37